MLGQAAQGTGRGLKALGLAAVVALVVGLVVARGCRPGERRFVQTSAPQQVTAPGRQPLEAPARAVAVGEKAPPLALPLLTGEMTPLDKWRGRVVVLNVWASWCPPCVREMPSLERLHRQGGEDFLVVGVSVDDERPKARALAERAEVTFPSLFDAGGRRMQEWGTVKYPETWILSPDGAVVSRVVGEQEWDSPAIVEQLRAWKRGPASAQP